MDKGKQQRCRNGGCQIGENHIAGETGRIAAQFTGDDGRCCTGRCHDADCGRFGDENIEWFQNDENDKAAGNLESYQQEME